MLERRVGGGGQFDKVVEGAQGLGKGLSISRVEGNAVGGDDFAKPVADQLVPAQLGEEVGAVGFEDEQGAQTELLALARPVAQTLPRAATGGAAEGAAELIVQLLWPHAAGGEVGDARRIEQEGMDELAGGRRCPATETGEMNKVGGLCVRWDVDSIDRLFGHEAGRWRWKGGHRGIRYIKQPSPLRHQVNDDLWIIN